jgi:hypothetical protein
VAALARIAAQVRPNGIVAFLEMEMSDVGARDAYGDSLLGEVVRTIYRTFATAGVRVHMASELRQTFVKAGLGEPGMLGEFVVGGGPDFAGTPGLRNTMRSLVPMARKFGIPLEPLGDLGNSGAAAAHGSRKRKQGFLVAAVCRGVCASRRRESVLVKAFPKHKSCFAFRKLQLVIDCPQLSSPREGGPSSGVLACEHVAEEVAGQQVCLSWFPC